MSSALARHERGAAAVAGQWTDEQVAILKNQICKGASDGDLALFQEVCKRHGLDPFTRQIHAVMRKVKDGDRWVDHLTIQVGIDGLRVQAQRSGLYCGQTPPQWTDGSDCPACKGLCSLDRAGETIICPTCDGTGVRWRGVWVADENPAAARVGVYIDGQPRPVWGVAAFKRYAQRTRDGSLNSMWRTMGPEMAAKCAEALALRKACPNDCSGLYIREEMAVEEPDHDHDDKPVGPPTGRQKITGRPAVVEPDPVPEPEPVSELDQKAKAAANRKAHALASEVWGPAGHLALRIHVAQASRDAVKKWSDADEASRNKVLAHVESVAETGTDETCKACRCADLATECEKYKGGLKAAEVVVAKSTGGQSLFEQLFTLSQELAAVEPPNEGENSVS